MIDHKHCDCCMRAHYATCCICKEPTGKKSDCKGSPMLQAADALAKAAKDAVNETSEHNPLWERVRTRYIVGLSEALAAYEKIRGVK